MKPVLRFEPRVFKMSDFGPKSSIPPISDMLNVQNRTCSRLDEDEGLFVGYGNLANSFPYPQRNEYRRTYQDVTLETAVLENDYLRATFLPSLGGRLWELIDKTANRNLLYTNDIIRPSNLGVTNAWFSGGVEWNIGIIGHSPFTTEPLFTAELTTEEGDPVLRMYEFERIRELSYQIDFWLTEESRFLICRMRIQNDNNTLRPAYWWSNAAVPEYPGGRLIVPAKEAYTSVDRETCVIKLPTPMVETVDISYYNQIPHAVDYFFDVVSAKPRFIANLDASGYGMIQTSSSRLNGRKLFSWGHTSGARRWQGFLTLNAGDYIEVQSGVERTQYGCVPMPPKTVWEWIELYGPFQMAPDVLVQPYEQVVRQASAQLGSMVDVYRLDEMVAQTKESIARKPAQMRYAGSGYGALENNLRASQKKTQLAPHLDFGVIGPEQRQWQQLLETGAFSVPDPEEIPGSFMGQPEWKQLLERSVENKNRENWYAWYQLGLMLLVEGNMVDSRDALARSLKLQESCWAHHALAVLEAQEGDSSAVCLHAYSASRQRPQDLGMAKECLTLLLRHEGYEKMLSLIDLYSEEVLSDGRVQMLYAYALLFTGDVEAADQILNQNGGLEVADIREGEETLTDLWRLVEYAKHPEKELQSIVVPQFFDFRMHGESRDAWKDVSKLFVRK